MKDELQALNAKMREYTPLGNIIQDSDNYVMEFSIQEENGTWYHFLLLNNVPVFIMNSNGQTIDTL
jgi:hypothetical protein